MNGNKKSVNKNHNNFNDKKEENSQEWSVDDECKLIDGICKFSAID